MDFIFCVFVELSKWKWEIYNDEAVECRFIPKIFDTWQDHENTRVRFPQSHKSQIIGKVANFDCDTEVLRRNFGDENIEHQFQLLAITMWEKSVLKWRSK